MKLNLFYVLFSVLMMSSCTVTVSQTATDTHGYANDIVDEAQSSDASASADLKLPEGASKFI